MTHKVLLGAFLLLSGFLMTLGLTPLFIRIAGKLRLIDQPHKLGIHKKGTPTGGGFAFGIPAILLQYVVYRFTMNPEILVLIACSAGILLIGYIDDRWKLRPWHKLILQIVVITVAYAMGFRTESLTTPFGDPLSLGFLTYPLTLFWFLLVMNAINLIDGIDGAAAGIATIVSIMLFTVGLHYRNLVVVYLLLVTIGTCLAFLRYNFHPAKLFMGDTGSLFLGFNLAAISMMGIGPAKGVTAMTMMIPIVVLFIPLFDTLLAIGRRIRRTASIFSGDSDHLHHKLLDFGFSQRTVAAIIYFITILFGLIAIGFSLATDRVMNILLLILSLFLMFIFYYLIHTVKKVTIKFRDRQIPAEKHGNTGTKTVDSSLLNKKQDMEQE